MIRPALKDDAFLADVREAARTDQLSIWWLGQSGFLIQWRDRRLIFDPYLSDSLTNKYASSDKPHVRMTERVIAPEKLDFVDVVTSSHNHTDHLDAETLGPMRRASPRMELVIPEANRAVVCERLSCPLSYPRGLVAGRSVSISDFTIHGIPAAHNDLDCDAEGRHRFMGYVVQCGPWGIYHSGDTLHFDGMEEWLQPFDIDVALLPINGDSPGRRVAGNLDGSQAADLAHMIRADVVIPCHYDMFEFNTAAPDQFVSACERLKQDYRILRNGDRWNGVSKRDAQAGFR
jgi:L-ascorbate metabolism protein UlaG (beta-lactamase superfamily)